MTRTACLPCLVVAATALELAAPCLAQSEALVLTGDVLPDLGTITEIYEVATNDQGDWLATVRTDSMSSVESALFQNGEILWKPGDSLPGNPSEVFRGARAIQLDADGNYAWMEAVPWSIGAGSGAYVGDVAYAAPAIDVTVPGVAAGTTFKAVRDLALGSAGTLLVAAVIEDASTGEDVDLLVRFEPQVGGGVAQTLIAKSGDVFGSSPTPLEGFSTSTRPNRLDTNVHGSTLYLALFEQIELTPGVFGATPNGVYQGGAELALSAAASPIAGVAWMGFPGSTVSLNDAGDHAYNGRLQASGSMWELIVKNGSKLVQTGDVLDSITPFRLTEFGASAATFSYGRVDLSEDGHVLWFGGWDDPDTGRDSGLFLDDVLVVQEGVHGFAGIPFDDFGLFEEYTDRPSYDLSPDGNTIVLRAVLADGRIGAFRITPQFGLTGSTSTILLGAGGAQVFDVDVGADFANAPYLIAGSLSGTSPGLPISASWTLPLNVDTYTLQTFAHPNQYPLSGSFGTLDAAGRAQGMFYLVAGQHPSLAGLVIHHAAVVVTFTGPIPGIGYATNAVRVELLP